jgi:hypothetical protein
MDRDYIVLGTSATNRYKFRVIASSYTEEPIVPSSVSLCMDGTFDEVRGPAWERRSMTIRVRDVPLEPDFGSFEDLKNLYKAGDLIYEDHRGNVYRVAVLRPLSTSIITTALTGQHAIYSVVFEIAIKGVGSWA